MMQHSFWTDLRLQRRMMSYLLISREKKCQGQYSLPKSVTQ